MLANCENCPAIWLRWSICSTNVAATLLVSSFRLPVLLLIAFCRYCKLSFIGVSGFFISCATCLAISLHAPSLSLLANAAALPSSLATILLYSFTKSPISSFLFHLIASFSLPRFTSFILLLIKENERVMRFVIKKATTPAIKKMKALRFMMATKKLEISWRSFDCEVK